MTDPLATMRRNLARCGLDPDETIAKMRSPEWRDALNGKAPPTPAALTPEFAEAFEAEWQRSQASRPPPVSWTCFAKPAATGKTCGHINATGVHHNGNLCCEACGCTKAAGDARKQKDSEKR